MTFNDEPLDFKRKYKVALSDYLYNGGDNFEEFKDASLLSVDELLMNVLADYLRKHKVIEPGMDGRIQVTNQRYE
ncbi:bifunctional 2',3'-cyclic nucleotide 2'-phosphodiesterase/3'-nucleotidase precursor protein [compost metagenome]